MQAALVVNAASRSGHEAFETAEKRLRERGLDLTHAREVTDPEHLADVVRSVVDEGARLVVLGGGDGTVSSVAALLPEAGITLGLLPTGTANDLARTLGLPTDLVAACDVVADGRPARVDLGVVGDDVYLNLASVGLAVEVTKSLSPRLKRRLGAAAYPVAALRAYLRHRPFAAALHFPDGDHPDVELGDLLQVGVANGRYYGGGAVAAPEAEIDEGLLDVYAIPRGTAGQRLGVARHFVSGAFTRADHVLHVRTRRVRLTTSPSLPANVDGELSARTPLDFGVRPGALRVLVPADSPAP
ncbi:lipid kinase [Spongisporangium articulatum]|uniref:Lipid kinase n=1 Tax=Spongisporangium articulatum TaxID=3362603 RepID=A0ABW8AP47_9ACTN